MTSPALSQALTTFLAPDRDPQVRQAAAQAVAALGWEKTVAQTLEVLAGGGLGCVLRTDTAMSSVHCAPLSMHRRDACATKFSITFQGRAC